MIHELGIELCLDLRFVCAQGTELGKGVRVVGCAVQ